MEYTQNQVKKEGLRPYQKEAKQQILEAWKSQNAVMLQMPTATGKTRLFTFLIRELLSEYKERSESVRILVVAHRTELIDQISKDLKAIDINPGIVQGQREQHIWKNVQVASVMSLLSRRNEGIIRRKKFDYIIVDEAHHSLAKSYVKLFRAFPNAKKLGVTATPYRLNHESFTSLYDKLILTQQVSWYIQKGYLADFEYISIKPDSEVQRMVDGTGISSTGDFINAELDESFNNRRIRSKLYKSYKKHAAGLKGIVYAINKEHAQQIAALYSRHAVPAKAIDCDTPAEEREFLIKQFKLGFIRVLVNVDIFTEGFNCPDVSFIQLARPTKSLALYLQQVGRGLRKALGKNKCVIIDNVGLYNYFGLPDAERNWLNYFQGKDDVASEPSRNMNQGSVVTPRADDARFEEDDEEMVVVREAVRPQTEEDVDETFVEEIDESEEEQLEEMDEIEVTDDNYEDEPSATTDVDQFTLVDYYLVKGTPDSFSIYTLVKRGGKVTSDVASCVFQYRGQEQPIFISDDSYGNFQTIKEDVKLQTLLSFCAINMRISLESILNLRNICRLAKIRPMKSMDLFSFLNLVSQVYDAEKRKM